MEKEERKRRRNLTWAANHKFGPILLASARPMFPPSCATALWHPGPASRPLGSALPVLPLAHGVPCQVSYPLHGIELNESRKWRAARAGIRPWATRHLGGYNSKRRAPQSSTNPLPTLLLPPSEKCAHGGKKGVHRRGRRRADSAIQRRL